MKKSNKFKVTKDLVGRWVRTRWDDSGVLDGICTEVDLYDKKCPQAHVFLVADDSTRRVEKDQLIGVGPRVNAPVF